MTDPTVVKECNCNRDYPVTVHRPTCPKYLQSTLSGNAINRWENLDQIPEELAKTLRRYTPRTVAHLKAEAWDEAVRAVAGVSPKAIYNPYRYRGGDDQVTAPTARELLAEEYAEAQICYRTTNPHAFHSALQQAFLAGAESVDG